MVVAGAATRACKFAFARHTNFGNQMKLSARFLIEFTRGLYGPVQAIAFVPGDLAIRIGARSSDLLIDRHYALKLRHKHRFRYEHLQLIQTAINDGWVIRERGDLVFIYEADAPHFSTFVVVVKQAKDGEEIWLKTFHRIQPKKVKRLLRDHELLREHKTGEGLVDDE